MRLTLRTLLAYLDDVLEPADTKDIGQKIQESPMAQLLVSRIREVMRRRRLKAPEVFGPEMGIDPNIVAQYLDNTLQSDRYADVERVLLASDEMLAEAAACHEVLTIDPPEVAQMMRERLYALGPVDAASQLIVSGGPPPQVTKRTPESISIRRGGSTGGGEYPSHSSRSNDAITTVPDYLKRTPWSRRSFPSIIVALLVIVSSALLVPELWTRFRQANNEIKRKDVRDKVTVSDPLDDAANSIPGPNPGQEIASSAPDRLLPQASPSSAKVDRSSLLEGIDPVPPKDEFDEVPAPSPRAEANRITRDELPEGVRPLKGDRSEGPMVPEIDGQQPGAAKPFPVPPGAMKEVPINYISNEGVLLRQDRSVNHWYMIPHRSALPRGDLIASIEPFESVIDFDRGLIRATLIGETVTTLLDPDQSGIMGLSVQRGRILIQNGRDEENQPAGIGIAIGEDLWKLELLSSDTLCGLEITPRQSTQFQKLQDVQWYQASLYVITGRARWTNQQGVSQEVAERQALNIVPEKAVQIRSNPVSFSSAPDWTDSVRRKALPIRKHQSQIQFEKEFELDQPIEESMRNLVKSSKYPKIAELAAQCMAATDDHSALVETLAECPHEEARFAARDGLRRWLPLHPDRGAKLKDDLDSHYPPADADAVYQMLWGFSREDVINSKSNSWLFVNWMRSPKPEIRELADYWVERLMDKKTDYRALGGTAAQREAQVRRLEEQIERNNGLIKAP